MARPAGARYRFRELGPRCFRPRNHTEVVAIYGFVEYIPTETSGKRYWGVDTKWVIRPKPSSGNVPPRARWAAFGTICRWNGYTEKRSRCESRSSPMGRFLSAKFDDDTARAQNINLGNFPPDQRPEYKISPPGAVFEANRMRRMDFILLPIRGKQRREGYHD